jgi:hypothetical protein
LGEQVTGSVESFLGAAQFFSGRNVVRNAEFLQHENEFGMLRFIVANARVKFWMIGARQRFSTGAFVAPGAVGFGGAFRAGNVSAPAADGVAE